MGVKGRTLGKSLLGLSAGGEPPEDLLVAFKESRVVPGRSVKQSTFKEFMHAKDAENETAKFPVSENGDSDSEPLASPGEV